MKDFAKEEVILLLEGYRKYAKVQGTTEFGLQDFLKRKGMIEEFETPPLLEWMDESIENLIKLRATLQNIKV